MSQPILKRLEKLVQLLPEGRERGRYLELLLRTKLDSTGLVLPQEILSKLEERRDRCFLCKWILESYREHGVVSSCWFDYAGASMFPVESQVKHLDLEFGYRAA
jgi:hypothetical protein